MPFFTRNKNNQKKLIKIIEKLTSEKPFTYHAEIYQEIPEVWKEGGCGTGDLQMALIEFSEKRFLTIRDGNLADWNGYTAFRLSERGRRELEAWYRKMEPWKFILYITGIIATVGTFLYSISKK